MGTGRHHPNCSRKRDPRILSSLLLGTDLPGAVLVQDSAGASLPPEDGGANQTREPDVPSSPAGVFERSLGVPPKRRRFITANSGD
jgi:hypothetical protein